MRKEDFHSLKQGILDATGWTDESNTRSMKHTVTVNGKKYTFEAATKEEFKKKLRKLEEYENDDGC